MGKYRNKTDNDLFIAGRYCKAGEIIEVDFVIENPNFEEVEDGKPQTAAAAPSEGGVPPVQTPQNPGQQPASPAPQAPAATPANDGGAS